MPIRTTDKWRSKSRGTPEQAVSTFERWDSFPIGDVKDAVEEIYRLCNAVGLDAAMLVAHAALETGDERIGRGFLDENWAVVDSYRNSRNRYNIAGIGITDGTDYGYRFKSGTEAARAFVVHHMRYEIPGDDPAWDVVREYIPLDPRYTAVPVQNRGTVRTLEQMTGKWWTNSDGHINLASRGNSIFQNLPDQGEPEEPPMAGHTVTWPGMPGGPMTFSFPVYLNIVPEWRQNRPGIIARNPRRSIQHENGNRQAGARDDSMYCYNGSGGRLASWHGSVDHKEGYINLPANEVGWQAGDGSGPGNYNGIAVELCQLSYMLGTTQGRQARRNAAEMLGRASARLDIDDPDQHADFMVKNCPEFLRNNPQWWADYVKDWTFFRADEKKRMAGGGGDTPEPVEIGIGDLIGTTVELNFRQAPDTAAPIVTVLPVGAEVRVLERPAAGAGGYTWARVAYVRPEGRIEGYTALASLTGDPWVRMIEDVEEPPPAKEYAKPVPVQALLDTDLKKYDTAEGIVTENENTFVFVADVIEFTELTYGRMWASEESEEVHEPYPAGTRRIGAWLVFGKPAVEGDKAVLPEPYYLLAGGDDEWVRVRYANTKRFSDAPLLPDAEDKV